ncbi:MAG: M48 family metallopeptidase [Alphaproteobacteria bacterium]
MTDNVTTSPSLAEAKMYGPVPWEAERKEIVFGKAYFPMFAVYGRTTAGHAVPVAIRTDLFHWATILQHRGSLEAGKLFATDRPARPFVTDWDIAHDKGLWMQMGAARFNFMFLLWGMLAFAFPVLFYFWLSADPGRVVSPQERWQRDEAFRQKVRDLEVDYKGRPAALRAHTVMLAFMGYAALLGAIILLLCTGVGLAIVIVALTQAGGLAGIAMMVPVGFALKLGSSLLRPRGGDNGVRLEAKDAPALFAMLYRICDKAKGPPFERIFITGIMNASVSRATGKLGFFGFGPVTLSLGLPLMQALSPEQLEAVVSHEYGHVAAKDNAFGQWVYRIRNSWLFLGERLKTEQLWYVLRLNRFYQWFLGFFSPYSFMLSRQCEYEADAFAARIVGNRKVAEALLAVDIYAERMRVDFWEKIWNKAKVAPEPQETPYLALASFFRQPRDVKGMLADIEKEETGFDSTHPATVERVRALGTGVAAPPLLSGSAAAQLLGPLEGHLCIAFDRNWQAQNRSLWQERYMQHQYCLKRRDELCERRIGHLSRDELYDLVSVASLLDDDKKVIEACNEILAREPDNMSARVNMLGYRLTTQSDEAALLKIEDILRTHTVHTPVICRFALRYFHAQERLAEAKVWQFRLDEWNYRKQAADEERQMIFAADKFSPHYVSAEYVAKIKNYFRQYKVVGRVYMVRKEVTYLKEQPMIVVGVMRSPWTFNIRAANEELRTICQKAPFGPPMHIFVLNGLPGLRRKIAHIAEALIYKK